MAYTSVYFSYDEHYAVQTCCAFTRQTGGAHKNTNLLKKGQVHSRQGVM